MANLYQEFARGTFAMYMTGPWNIGEFKRRLPADLQDAWATAPLPAPDDQAGPAAPGLSLAGGASLVLFGGTAHPDAAWQLVEFLSQPAQQVRFYALSGDLPAHRAAWSDPVLADDPYADAFRRQLERVVPTPKIPEWEQVATEVWEAAESRHPRRGDRGPGPGRPGRHGRRHPGQAALAAGARAPRRPGEADR